MSSKRIVRDITECVQCHHHYTDKGRHRLDGKWREKCSARSRVGRVVDIHKPIPSWCPLPDTPNGGCPFCGKQKCITAWMDPDDTDGAWVASCDVNKGGCGSSTGYIYATEQEAVAAWNTRHTAGHPEVTTRWMKVGTSNVESEVSE